MAEKITCVNGDVLKWARVQCGNLQLKSVQEIMPKIEAWEKGEDFPTYAQLEKLADAYKKPIAVFFFPQPPEGIAYNAEFRTTSDVEIHLLPHKVTRLINEALVMQLNIEELEPNLRSKDTVLHNKLKGVPNNKLVSTARTLLGIDIETQLQTKNPREMLGFWRDAFCEQGIYVFKEAFSDKSISGFCIYDERIPIIYLNNSMSFTRQIFTLFHELYHLIHETGGIDRVKDISDDTLSKEQQDIEKMCNQFAATFLLPAKDITRIIGNQKITYDLVCDLANKFCVSKEAIILRLISLKKTNWDFYNEYIGEIYKDFERIQPKKKGGNPNRNLVSYLGGKYLKLAFSAYRENRIDAFQLASYTKTKVSNIPALEQTWGWKA